MSPQLQEEFAREALPVLTAAVPRTVCAIGSEDPQELVQEALAMACQAADALEKKGQPVPLRSVCYYTLQRLKTGRRNTSSGRTDVLSPAFQLDGNGPLLSLGSPVTSSKA